VKSYLTSIQVSVRAGISPRLQLFQAARPPKRRLELARRFPIAIVRLQRGLP
jgi:hypothetical protein